MHKKTIGLIFLLTCLFFSFPVAYGKNNSNIKLTDEEKNWIQNNPTIRVANELDWPPFDFNETGTPKGLGIDYIKLLAKKTGVEIEFVYGYAWADLIELFKQRKIDVMPVFYKNKEREKFTLYTEPYYKGKLGIFTNTDNENKDINLANMRVGMEKGHGSIPIVKKMFPGISIIEIEYKMDLVRKLATNQLDAIIGNPFVFYFHAKENQINNIRLSEYIKMNNKEQSDTSLHIGIRDDWPVFYGILKKAMANVSANEMGGIEKKWTNVTIANQVNWALIFQISTIIILIVFFLLWHNRRLKATVEAKTQELKRLNEELEYKVEERTEKLTELNVKLSKSIEELNTLRGIIPICASCKKIRDDSGYWNQIEAYISKHSMAEFSHSICPDCVKKLYPELVDENDDF